MKITNIFFFEITLYFNLLKHMFETTNRIDSRSIISLASHLLLVLLVFHSLSGFLERLHCCFQASCL